MATFQVWVRTDDAETLDHYPWLKKHVYLHDDRLPIPSVGDVICFKEIGSSTQSDNFLQVVGREFWLAEKDQSYTLVVALPNSA